MPLIVYLDTQDYIALFNEPVDGPNHEILRSLLMYRDRGEILIGFSFLTVVEFITKPDARNRNERVRRGELIRNICGKNAFPSFAALSNGARFPNNGYWLLSQGDRVVSAESFKQKMHKALVEKAANADGLNRHERRKISRKSTMQELLRKSGTNFGRDRADYGDLPVSDELIASRLFERFMKGQCSNTEFENRLTAWLHDPVEYSRIVYDYSDQPNFVDKFVSDHTKGFEACLKAYQESLEHIVSLNHAKVELRRDLVETGMDKRTARNFTKAIEIPKFTTKEPSKRIEAILGKGRARHVNHYLARALKRGYSFKHSDLMDVMHLSYAYDSDLFRCDKAMADTFRNFAPFGGKLVARFTDLPEHIERRLAEFDDDTP